MDEVEVDGVDTQVAAALLELRKGVLVALGGISQLGGDEDLVPGDSAGPHCLAAASLVAVRGSGVDVAVAGLQGAPRGTSHFIRLNLVDAETQLGDRYAIVEDNRGTV